MFRKVAVEGPQTVHFAAVRVLAQTRAEQPATLAQTPQPLPQRAEPLPEVELPTANRPVPSHGGPKDTTADPPTPDLRPRSRIRAIPKVVRHRDLPPKPWPVPSPSQAVQKEYEAGPGTAPRTTEEGRVAGSSDGGAKPELQAAGAVPLEIVLVFRLR